jgi:hypothetical protein
MPLPDIDALFTITCGHCGATNPVAQWTQTALCPVPHGTYQCPRCRWAFRRVYQPKHRPWEPAILLHTEPSML